MKNGDLKRDANFEIDPSTFGEFVDYSVQINLSTKHSKHDLMTEAAILFVQAFFKVWKENRRECTVALDPQQDIERCSTCR